MPDVSCSISAVIGGVTIAGSIVRSGETPLSFDIDTLPAAKTGSLTTRTDDNTGVITATAGHGFVTGAVLDVYWELLGVNYVRRGMDATVSVNAITVDGGAGDVLPATTTALTFSQVQTVLQGFDPDILNMLLFTFPRETSIRFMADAVVALALHMPAGEVYSWFSGLGVTNPCGADPITSILLSNGDSAGTSRVRGGCVLDSVAAL